MPDKVHVEVFRIFGGVFHLRITLKFEKQQIVFEPHVIKAPGPTGRCAATQERDVFL